MSFTDFTETHTSESLSYLMLLRPITEDGMHLTQKLFELISTCWKQSGGSLEVVTTAFTGLTMQTQTSYVIILLFYLIKTPILVHSLSPLSWWDALLTLCGRAEYYFLTVTAGLDQVVIEIQPEWQVGMSSVLSNRETQKSCHIVVSWTWTEQSLWNSVILAREKWVMTHIHPAISFIFPTVSGKSQSPHLVAFL